jgi:hypothetical protein
MPIGGDNAFPSLLEVSSLVRSILNEDGAGATDTVGEGQIAVDNPAISPAMGRLMTASIAETYREMRNSGSPELIADNYIVLNLPPVNGPNGPGSPAAETQTALMSTGYFDGTEMWPTMTLPSNMLAPWRIWERATGATDFVPMEPATAGLPPCMQGSSFRLWEWRGGSIWFPGATQPRDIRLRYSMKLPLYFGPNINFASTFIPLQDCVSAVAYKTAAKFAMRLQGSTPNSTALDTKAAFEIGELQNESVRRQQRIAYHRQPYPARSR